MSAKRVRLVNRIRQAYPHLEIHTAELDETGQNNDILLVNGEIIFRFPRYAAALEQIRVEAAVLAAISARVPLPVPTLEYGALDGKTGGEVFTGYRRLPGVPLRREAYAELEDEPVREHLAAQLAGFLKALHTTPMDQVGATLPRHDTRRQCEDLYRRMCEKLFPHMRPDARQWTAAHFEPYLADPANFASQPVLKHGDFGTTNILFDPKRRQISGIIDFGNAALGDPAYDFAGLLSSYGEDFLASCARTYLEVERFLPRVRFYQGTFALLEALFGVEQNDERAFVAGMAQYV